MKNFILSAIILFTSFMAISADDANTKMGKKLITEEITKYADDYGVEEIFEIDFLGVANKQYSFVVIYSKQFCFDSGDDERMSCALYKCESQADIDGDAIVSFESESKRSRCEKIEGTDSTRQY